VRVVKVIATAEISALSLMPKDGERGGYVPPAITEYGSSAVSGAGGAPVPYAV
jgi:hypothetical protein